MEGFDLTVSDLKDICRRRGISSRGKNKKQLQNVCLGKRPKPVRGVPRAGDPKTEWKFETPTEWPDIPSEEEEEEEIEASKLYSRYVKEEEDEEPRKLKPFSAGEDVRKRKGVVRKRKRKDAPRVPGLPSGWQEGIYVPLIPPIGLTEEQQVKWQMDKQRALVAWTQSSEDWPPKASKLELFEKDKEISALITKYEKEISKCRELLKSERGLTQRGRAAERAIKVVSKTENECEAAKEKLRQKIASLEKNVKLARGGNISASTQNQINRLVQEVKEQERLVTRKDAQLQREMVASGKMKLVFDLLVKGKEEMTAYRAKLENEMITMRLEKTKLEQQIKEQQKMKDRQKMMRTDTKTGAFPHPQGMPPADSPYYPRNREILWFTNEISPWVSQPLPQIKCANQFCMWNIKNKEEYERFVRTNPWMAICKEHAVTGKFCKPSNAKEVWVKPALPNTASEVAGKTVGDAVIEILDNASAHSVLDKAVAVFYRDLWTKISSDYKKTWSKKLKNVARIRTSDI